MWMSLWTSGLRNRQGTTWPTERLCASQEGISFMEPVNAIFYVSQERAMCNRDMFSLVQGSIVVLNLQSTANNGRSF
jgi:hypothetical protein